MKAINTKPNISMPKIKLPPKPVIGVRMPKLPGIVNPLRLKK